MAIVVFGKTVSKSIEKLPDHIQVALGIWIKNVTLQGVQIVRKIPGYHDEPLQGKRLGQRSARLNRSYRVIYKEVENGIKIKIFEVNKHKY